MIGNQPAGSESIILVKGNTGGKSLVVGSYPKESMQTSMGEKALVKSCQIQKVQNHTIMK
jgi:hypothetical protein